MRRLVCALMVAGIAAIGCKQEGGTEASTGAKAEAAKPAAAAASKPAAAPAAEEAAPAEGGDSIGVAECDDYMKKMKDCMGNMPAESKAAMETAFKQTTDAWKKAAATEGGKQGLSTACKTALDALDKNPACNK